MKPFGMALAALVVIGAFASGAYALTAEEKCRKGRFDAKASYADCHESALAKLYGSPMGATDFGKLPVNMAKCRLKLHSAWMKLELQAFNTGSSCDRPRFEDNGDGTVSDHLTGLVWEKKDNAAGVHDRDNVYDWTVGSPYKETGTAFSSFLSALNTSAFAGSRGWRIPTLAELQTILLPEGYPCASNPCIDPIFGSMATGTVYWSSTTALGGNYPENALSVVFTNGGVLFDPKVGFLNVEHARAVRSGE